MTRSLIDGFDAVRVETDSVALTLMPELGGKISSLRDLRTGREWLWRHPRLAYRRVAHGGSYVTEADTGGWDECFPSVAPCEYPAPPWSGAALQDHGELWSQPAGLEVREDAAGVHLRMRWRGVALPYAFERTLSLGAGSARIRVEYAALNTADAPLHFIWCAHPLLAIEPEMQVQVSPAARFNRWASLPGDLVAQDSGLGYPLTVAAGRREIDLATLPDASAGIALKLWSDPLPAGSGWAALRARDGGFRLHWDVAHLPQLALWMNLGAWAGDGGAPYFNLGLEPCLGAQDSLADAVMQRKPFATLPPGGSRAWWLEVELAV